MTVAKDLTLYDQKVMYRWFDGMNKLNEVEP